MMRPLGELIIGLLPMLVFIILVWGASRFGSSIDKRILRKYSAHFPRAAIWLSWGCGSSLLAFAIYCIFIPGVLPGAIILIGCIAVAHMTLMIWKKNSIAFRVTGIELLLVAFALWGYLYPPIPGQREPPMSVGTGEIGFWIWIIGGFALVTAAWICHRAASGPSK